MIGVSLQGTKVEFKQNTSRFNDFLLCKRFWNEKIKTCFVDSDIKYLLHFKGLVETDDKTGKRIDIANKHFIRNR